MNIVELMIDNPDIYNIDIKSEEELVLLRAMARSADVLMVDYEYSAFERVWSPGDAVCWKMSKRKDNGKYKLTYFERHLLKTDEVKVLTVWDNADDIIGDTDRYAFWSKVRKFK